MKSCVFAVACASAILTAGAGVAQTPSAPPTATPPTRSPPTPTGPTVIPPPPGMPSAGQPEPGASENRTESGPALIAAQALIRELNRENALIEAQLIVIETAPRANAAALDPASLSQLNEYLRAHRVEMLAASRDFEDSISRVYARNMTADDLREALVFARQPAGRRFFLSQPRMAMDALVSSQAFQQRVYAAVMRRMQGSST